MNGKQDDTSFPMTSNLLPLFNASLPNGFLVFIRLVPLPPAHPLSPSSMSATLAQRIHKLPTNGGARTKGDIGFPIPDGAGFTVKPSPGFLRISVRISAARCPKAAMPSLSSDSRKDDNFNIHLDAKDRRFTLKHFHCRSQQIFPYECNLFLNILSGYQKL